MHGTTGNIVATGVAHPASPPRYLVLIPPRWHILWYSSHHHRNTFIPLQLHYLVVIPRPPEIHYPTKTFPVFNLHHPPNTAGINRSNTAARAVLEQPCSTGGRTDTVRPKREPTGRTDLSDRSRLVLCNRSQELIGQACPTRRQVLRSDSACPTTGRTRLFEHCSNCPIPTLGSRPANVAAANTLGSGPANETTAPTLGSNNVTGTNTATPNQSSTRATTRTLSQPRPTGDQVAQSFQDADHHIIRVAQAATCQNKRITNAVKDELQQIMLEYQKQVQLVALRSQIRAELLFKWLGVYNKLRTPNQFNNFCRYSPDARKIFALSM
ncbi:hypothetical protein PCASD_09398 [Puccinia coronata f. sp. avenae]|uniref:Uncharacterized protein n=1 Tax=Puccinia coronata f. sp. avenae TaxID=200324 RepID=A0A2N5V1L5_9BASI|nr:hypothetical protein PCASD_09398 [Puccinia coronata f. sp. avenae]